MDLLWYPYPFPVADLVSSFFQLSMYCSLQNLRILVASRKVRKLRCTYFDVKKNLIDAPMTCLFCLFQPLVAQMNVSSLSGSSHKLNCEIMATSECQVGRSGAKDANTNKARTAKLHSADGDDQIDAGVASKLT